MLQEYGSGSLFVRSARSFYRYVAPQLFSFHSLESLCRIINATESSSRKKQTIGNSTQLVSLKERTPGVIFNFYW